ncbi:MAG: DoxX family membrane protein [Bacteroidetes bacterium]|nr:DoxX family membrane protein [Bacteroidota bacterium]
MRYLVGFARIVVGLLFIFSGLIKLNDPVGFSFKLQDYFAPEVLNLEFLVPYSLGLAIIIVIVEVILGVTLLLGYMRRLTLWLLLLMIVFFTFLTFYSAYFNKVTDCGCFGDAIPLTPWESFWKDVILLVLIIILFVGRRYIRPIFTTNVRSMVVLVTFLLCLGLGYYVLQHLPIIDFRAYKIGTNIAEGMRVPEDAPKAVYEYKWKFNVNGKEEIITTTGEYPNVDGEFIDVETRMVKEGYIPPIHDFTIEKDGTDYTDEFLNRPNLIVVIAYSVYNTEKEGYKAIKKATDKAKDLGYDVIGLSASTGELTTQLIGDYNLNFDFYFCDETTLKTIVRSNPGILELQNGTITQKYHWNDAGKLKLVQVENPKLMLDTNRLKKDLDSIAARINLFERIIQSHSVEERVALGKEFGLTEDEAKSDLSSIQTALDRSNFEYLASVMDQHWYPGKTMVGEPTNLVGYEILKRQPEAIENYILMLQDFTESGELPMTHYATLEDLLLMYKQEPQKYGTQGYIDSSGNPYIWPIDNPETVNERRAKVGFTTTIEEYAKELFGEDFVYRPVSLEEVL